jgi:L-ascorbate metabolism protein UlaG (beta-lactamase superfamily)
LTLLPFFDILVDAMEIKYAGHASFQIKTKDAKIVMDPFNPTIGLKYPKTEASIVTISHHHPDHDFVSVVGGNPLIIDWPGEFEKDKVRIFGHKSFHDKVKGAERGENILYKLEIEGISLLHCGDLGVIPDDSFIDDIGEVDVLFVPTGGVYTIDSVEAVKLIKKIEPVLVIPMHYNNPKLNQEQFGKLEPVESFIQKLGATPSEPVQKLVLRKEDLSEEMKVQVMEIGV